MAELKPKNAQDTDHASQIHKNKSLERPPDTTIMEKMKKFLWDKDKKTCCTRTPLNWTTITIYYIIFVACLAGIFMLTIFSVEVFLGEGTGPNFNVEGGPGLGFVPQVMLSSPLLWLSKDKAMQNKYIKDIEKFFAKTTAETSGLGNCTSAPFGYDGLSPCIFLSLNKKIGWKPTAYDGKAPLPDTMPKELQDKVKGDKNADVVIWCQGTNTKDKERLPASSITYTPGQSFPASGFPVDIKTDPPIIAVVVTVPPETRGLVHEVVCRAWAGNLDALASSTDVVLYADPE